MTRTLKHIEKTYGDDWSPIDARPSDAGELMVFGSIGISAAGLLHQPAVESWIYGDLMVIHGDLMAIYGDLMVIHGDLMAIYGDLMVICGDLMIIYGDLMVIYGGLMGCNGGFTLW